MESNNCYYSYSYSYFFNFHAELSTLENLEMLDLGSNVLNFSHKMQGKEREREREREISNFQPLLVQFLVDYANRRQISKLFKYKNNYGDDVIRSRLVGSCTFT